MKDCIDVLIKYYKEKDSKLLVKELDISVKDLNVIIIETLHWLKVEYKRELWIAEGKNIVLKPLLLDDDFSWCQNLICLVEKEDLFRNYFVVKNNTLFFSDTICEEERSIAREKACKEYQPFKKDC